MSMERKLYFPVVNCSFVVYTPVIIRIYAIIMKGGRSHEPLFSPQTLFSPLFFKQKHPLSYKYEGGCFPYFNLRQYRAGDHPIENHFFGTLAQSQRLFLFSKNQAAGIDADVDHNKHANQNIGIHPKPALQVHRSQIRNMTHALPVHQQTHASSHHHRLKCCSREAETKCSPLGTHLACQKSTGIYNRCKQLQRQAGKEGNKKSHTECSEGYRAIGNQRHFGSTEHTTIPALLLAASEPDIPVNRLFYPL